MATRDRNTIDLTQQKLCIAPDVMFWPVREQGELVYRIEIPKLHRFFRVGYEEYVFLSLLDGQTTIPQACGLAASKLGSRAPTTEQAKTIARWLLTNGLAHLQSDPPPTRNRKVSEPANFPQPILQVLGKVNPFWIKVPLPLSERWINSCRANLALVNGKRLYKQDRLDEAIESFQEAIDLQPNLTKYRYKLAHMQLMNGEPQQALSTFQSININKDKGYKWHKSDLFLAKVHADLGEFNKALSYLQAAVAKGHAQPDLLVDDRFEELMDRADYASLTQRALKIQHQMKKAKKAMNEKDWDLAINAFEQALKLAPDAHGVHSKMGLISIYAERYDQAISHYKKHLGFDPDNATSHYNLACSYALSGKSKKALRSLESAIANGFDDSKLVMKDTDLDSIRESKGFDAIIDELVREHELGREIEQAFKVKDYDKVLQAVERADSMNSLSDSDKLWLRKKEAFAYYYLKQFPEASDAFRDLILHSKGKGVANSFYNLACVYALNGDIDPAFNALQASFDLGYTDASNFAKDSDLENLRSDSRFSFMKQRIQKASLLKKLNVSSEAELESLMKQAAQGDDLGKRASKVAWAAYKLQNWDAAINAFKQTLKSKKGSGATAYNIACCYALSGDSDTSIKWLKKIY